VAESIVNSKGQTMVPASVRASLNVQPGTCLCWHVILDGTVIVRVKSKSICDLAGSVKTDKHVDIEDMNPWRG
jgi:antitoxin PrlF